MADSLQCFLSSELRAERAESDVGIEAVPAGSYQETNPYLLLQSSTPSSLLPVESQPERINYLDWSRADLLPGHLLRVKIVEVANFNTLYLHPDDSSSQYLGWSKVQQHLTFITLLVAADVFTKHEETFLELQRKCEKQPPVCQPR